VTYLLAVNLLIALFDANHLHHSAAQNWFATRGGAAWATCPITENGLIRIFSSPSYPNLSATPAEVAARLAIACQDPGHEFWPDNVSLATDNKFELRQLQGSRQVTDAYLLLLCARRNGTLATFDAGLSSLWSSAPLEARVELIATTSR
jgi:toxin-antitoxin system PIN domain toxin